MGNLGDLSPYDAQDAAGFVELMRRLKERSGLTYRELEEQAARNGDVLARSTLAEILRRTSLPRPEPLAAFVRACGDGQRVRAWLDVRERIAAQPAQPAQPAPAHVPAARRLRGGTALAVSAALSVLVAGAVWMLAAAGEPEEGKAVPDAKAAAASASASASASVAGPAVPTGWVRIRPVTAPRLCLTDGRVLDRRYTPLVAVQRPCDKVSPQTTMLEPVGGDAYRIQWHHPDYGRGCLKALAEGPGTGLLEPIDDCAQDSRFHLEPSGPPTGGRYVLRVDGRGCVGIKGSVPSEGAEAVMGRCVGKGGQLFFIESAS